MRESNFPLWREGIAVTQPNGTCCPLTNPVKTEDGCLGEGTGEESGCGMRTMMFVKEQLS